MNIHHLELFYFVARHGGISEAVRNIPYGIQQPAVSGQILQLEDHLGVTLFNRRPFSLTPAGDKLYQYIFPFFSSLDAVATELQGGIAHQIRIGASEVVLRDHLPIVAQTVRKRFPKLKIALREGYEPELESWLLKQEIDLAITVVQKKPAPGLQSLALIELPLILLVAKGSKITTPDQLWKLDRIDEPLICLPASETLCKNFQQSLARIGVDWIPGIEVSSIQLIETYVANGFGIGLGISVPKAKLHPEVRAIPLAGFGTIEVGAIWRGKMTPLIKSFVDESQNRARQIFA
jgi:DNA-binding transcriptional LysR family regulator